jgi:hypothetical protein
MKIDLHEVRILQIQNARSEFVKNITCMDNKTQFWQIPVNSLIFLILIFIKDNLILHIVIFKI